MTPPSYGVRRALKESIFTDGHNHIQDSKAKLTKPLPRLKRNGKVFLENLSRESERECLYGQLIGVSNCSFLLQDVYSLRLFIYRDFLPKLATPPSTVPNEHTGGFQAREKVSEHFT